MSCNLFLFLVAINSESKHIHVWFAASEVTLSRGYMVNKALLIRFADDIVYGNERIYGLAGVI